MILATRRLLVALGLALVTLSQAALGQTVVHNVRLDSRTQSGLLPQANPALGILSEVLVQLTAGVDRTFSYNVLGPVSGTARGDVQFQFFFPNTSTYFLGSYARSDVPFTGSDGIAIIRVTDIPVSASVPTASLSPFVGTGTINFQIGGNVVPTSSTPNAVFTPIPNSPPGASAIGTVTYVYGTAAIPEPSPLVLGAVAAASGLAAAHWRRRRRSG